MRGLSDERWTRLLADIGPLPPAADLDRARREIEDALHAYLGLLRSPEGVLATRERWRRVEKLVSELQGELLDIKRHTPWGIDDPDRLRRYMVGLRPLWEDARAHIDACNAMAPAAQGRRDPARDWLYWRLLAIWTDALGGKLGVTTRPDDGALVGPLIPFLRQVTAVVFDADEIPTPDGVRFIVRREKRRRAATRRNQG